ncbi:MAG: hypothetical protein V1729_00235 [Candidatus Woesearchaeota archaeon]
MIIRLLGVADLLTAAAVLLLHYDLLGWRIGFLFVAYLIIKGWLFRSDINSVVDILCGVYMFIMLFGLTTIATWFIVIYLFQKAVFSLA